MSKDGDWAAMQGDRVKDSSDLSARFHAVRHVMRLVGMAADRDLVCPDKPSSLDFSKTLRPFVDKATADTDGVGNVRDWHTISHE